MHQLWIRSLARRRTLARLLRQAEQAQQLVVDDIPSMIWISEQQFLYLLARDYYRGVGLIVDAGIFLGSSTRAYTAGLRDRPDLDRLLRAGRPVRSYDLALCDDFMASLINAHYGKNYQPGDSFLEILANNIRGCEDCVQFCPGDITDQTVDVPIEVLFLDVCKTSAVNTHMIKEFFPRLIPGHSVLIQQDFVHEWLPWIHVAMGFFEPYFQFLGVVGESPSAVWLNTRKIPSTTSWECERGGDLYRTAPLPQLVKLFERGTRRLTSDNQQYVLGLAKSRMMAERGDRLGAMRLLDRLIPRFDQLHHRPSYYPHPNVMKDFIGKSVNDNAGKA